MAKRKKKNKKRASSADAARRRAENHKGVFDQTTLNIPDGVQLFKIEDAKKAKRLDILAYPIGAGNPNADEGEMHYERTFYVHKGIGPDNKTYVCPAKTAGKKCPICEYRAKLANDDDADEETVKALGPKERQLFNVIDTKDREKGVQIWDISYHLFGKQLDAEIKDADEDDVFGAFADVDGGMTLKIGFTEEHYGKFTYYESSTINFKNREEEYDDDIIDELHILDNVIKILSYDELKAILLQIEDGDEEEKTKSKKKATKKKATKKKTKKEEEPDDDDDDELDDDDDDDELDDDELDDDDDDELDDDDDDDDDELDDDDDDDDDDELDDDDDDEDDWDDDDDDDNEPKSKKKAKKTAKKKTAKKKVAKRKKK